jgi:hypothetical protein
MFELGLLLMRDIAKLSLKALAGNGNREREKRGTQKIGKTPKNG